MYYAFARKFITTMIIVTQHYQNKNFKDLAKLFVVSMTSFNSCRYPQQNYTTVNKNVKKNRNMNEPTNVEKIQFFKACPTFIMYMPQFYLNNFKRNISFS